MPIAVTYLLDPLCGWCYGAAPVIGQLAQQASIQLDLLPTGLFVGGDRTMDAAFAEYAWSNDQRIAQRTGQSFTEAYRQQVLGRTGSPFDSAAATLALTAASLTAPQREMSTLRMLQQARYVQGLDICDAAVVASLLREQGLDAAADLLASGNAGLQAANIVRIEKALSLMERLGAQGVPHLVVHSAQGDRLLGGSALYGDLETLLHQIEEAAGRDACMQASH